MTLYDCPICRTINGANRLHCVVCGTIPPHYAHVDTMRNKCSRFDDLSADYIEVVAAYGCERQTDRRASKTYMRTVPLDYYADAIASKGE